MAGLTRTLPTSVFVALDEREANRQINEALDKANQSYAELQQMENDLGAIPTNLADINIAWMDSVISAKVEAIQAMPLPQSSIHSMISDWRKIEQKATEAISAIQALFDGAPSLICQIEDGAIICDNKEEWVTTKATYIIPEKYKEHFRLVGNLIEAVTKLRYYEKKNRLKSFPADMLINSVQSVDDYTRFIVEGTFEQEMTKEQFNRMYNYELSKLK